MFFKESSKENSSGKGMDAPTRKVVLQPTGSAKRIRCSVKKTELTYNWL
jgi:hypothetical protein